MISGCSRIFQLLRSSLEENNLENTQEIDQKQKHIENDSGVNGFSVLFTWNISGDIENAPEDLRIYDPSRGIWISKDMPGVIWVPPAPPHASVFEDAQPDHWAKQVIEALTRPKEARERFLNQIEKKVNEIYPGEEFTIDYPRGKVLNDANYSPVIIAGDLRREAVEFIEYLRTGFPLAELTPSELAEFEQVFNHDLGME